VIKKAGLTIAVAAAGMLAISPLAFAGDWDGDGGWGGGGHHGNGGGHSSHGGGHGGGHGPTQIQNGLVNLQDVADLNANACGNNIGSNILGILSPQTAVAGGSCKITDEDGGGRGTQIQNGLVNAQDVVDANINACGNNILDNIAGVASSQTALAAAKCKVTDK
jgi:hypothetical protein